MKFTFFIILSLFSSTFTTQETKIINLKNVSAYQAIKTIKASCVKGDVQTHENSYSENAIKIIGSKEEIELIQKLIDHIDNETLRIQTCKFICD